MYAESSKWCFVPNCGNTSINAPNKVFVTLPSEYSRKLKWFKAATKKAAKRDMPKSKSIFYCCEDHFNLLCIFTRLVGHNPQKDSDIYFDTMVYSNDTAIFYRLAILV
ncbi:hypothetical protein NQ315_002096 [Exocentrus adspersus]|uniref:THAP-type domain-containing protein n=1 Tax=Exocentrus adspersus TaxID=1586481 RepID=A0AAV8V932_9CUCU|nr:hypothetical protein NQ315_002096 [Exocentrus adspersus]